MGESKFDKASRDARNRTARRNGEDLLDEPTPVTALVKPGTMALDTGAMVRAFDPSVFVDGITDGEWDVAPQILELKEGQMITAVLVGRGAPAELEEINQGVVEQKSVDTWVLRDPQTGVKCSILTSAQLEAKLKDRIGHLVMIARGPETNTRKGRRVTEYLVKSRPMPSEVRSAIDTESA